MPRLPRCDRPGRWFHVFNRGIARRPVFETVEDIRYFLACLARAVRRGELEVHAYCIMTTHFHLLVRSPTGELAVAMDRVMNAYVRYYNRKRKRDGSLFRGRYGARPVDSLRYRRVVVRYIDRNAVRARLASAAWEFPHCSAWHYAKSRRPRWLATEWVDSVIVSHGFTEPWHAYPLVFGTPWARGEAALVRARMRSPVNREEILDDLIDAAPPAVLAWMRRKARVADGRALTLPCVDGHTLQLLVDHVQQREPTWRYETKSGRSRDAWPTARVYLYRMLAALTWTEIGRRVGIGRSMAQRRGVQGQDLIRSNPEFGDRVSRIAHEVVAEAHGAIGLR